MTKRKIIGVVSGIMLMMPFFCGSNSSNNIVKAEEAHNHTGWTAWTNSNSVPDAPGNYYLTVDVYAGYSWTINSGTTNLCLNGHIIDGCGIKVSNGAIFNLYDCQPDATHTGGYISIRKGGVIHGKGVTVDGATFNMYGGSINECQDFFQGGLSLSNSAIFNFYDGSIDHNTGVSEGGGVYMRDSTFNMYGGEVSYNFCNYGGGMFIGTNAQFNMYGGTFKGNESNAYGGGIYSESNVTLFGGVITENYTKDTRGGGGISICDYYEVSLEIGGSVQIYNNTSDNNPRASDLTLPANIPASIPSAHRPTSDMNVGLDVMGCSFSNALENDQQYFFSNLDNAAPFYDSNAKKVIMNNHSHQLYLVNGVIGCESGYKSYYSCSCGKYFEDSAGEHPIGNAKALATWKTTDGKGLVPGEHSLSLVQGNEAKCLENGFKDCYKCDNCNVYFVDDSAETSIGDEAAYQAWKVSNDGKISSLGHSSLKINGCNATSEEDGYKDTYLCTRCGEYFEDSNCTKKIGNEAAYEAWRTTGDGKLPATNGNKGISGGAVAGITIGTSLGVVLMVLIALYFVWKKTGKNALEPVYRTVNKVLFKTTMNDVEKKNEK